MVWELIQIKKICWFDISCNKSKYKLDNLILIRNRLSFEQYAEVLKVMNETKRKTHDYLRDSGREEWVKDRSLYLNYVK